MPAPRARPGPLQPSSLDPSPEERRLLARLLRLRVLTSFQAHWLVPDLSALNPETGRPRTERNTRKHLARLVERGLLEAGELHPEKGGFSGYYYRLSHRALGRLGSDDRHAVRPPPRPVLHSLVLRNEVYARARAEGWDVLSPVLSEEEEHPRLLERVHAWMRARLEQEARRGEADPAPPRRPLEELLPARLTFDCLLRARPESPLPDFVLCVVDDIRRTILPRRQRAPRTRETQEPCPLCGRGMLRASTPWRAVLRCPAASCPGERELPLPARAQVDELPVDLLGGSLLLRDSQSVWDCAGQRVLASPRLLQWQTALAARYGKDALRAGQLFPELWVEHQSSLDS